MIKEIKKNQFIPASEIVKGKHSPEVVRSIVIPFDPPPRPCTAGSRLKRTAAGEFADGQSWVNTMLVGEQIEVKVKTHRAEKKYRKKRKQINKNSVREFCWKINCGFVCFSTTDQVNLVEEEGKWRCRDNGVGAVVCYNRTFDRNNWLSFKVVLKTSVGTLEQIVRKGDNFSQFGLNCSTLSRRLATDIECFR